MSEHTETVVMMPVSEIVVANRLRADVGKVSALALSIQTIGLLHPIVLNSRRELVAGERRLTAVKELGWKAVPCRIVATLDDAVAALLAERDENTCRQPLTDREKAEAAHRLMKLESPDAEKRKKAGTNQHTEPSGKLPQGSTGKARDKVGAAIGWSGRTVDKAVKVLDAAEKAPDRHGDLPAVMQEKSVDAAYRELREREKPAPAAVDAQQSATKSPAPSDGKGVLIAHEAINCLMRIRRDDPQRARAFEMVADWMKCNSAASPVSWTEFMANLEAVAAFCEAIRPNKLPEGMKSWQLAKELETLARRAMATATRLRQNPR